MSFDSAAYLTGDGAYELLGVIFSSLGSNLVSFVWMAVAYVLTGLGFYAIAKRRGIRNPWMAWVPVLNAWILGSISDQYRYVTKGEIRNRRKVLIVLEALTAIITVTVTVLLIVMFVGLIFEIEDLAMMPEDQVLSLVLKSLLPLLAALLVLGIVALVNTIFVCIAYYDLFASCEPDNKVIYLILGILFGITLPVFVFVCRNKDLGMPPRKVQQPPVMEEPPVHREPEEPWVNSEE